MKTSLLFCLAALASGQVLGATYTWTGNGSNGLWSRAENWSNNTKPPANSTVSLTFPSGTPRLNSTNDIAGLTVSNWEVRGGNSFNGTGAGNTIGLSGDLRIKNLTCTIHSSLTLNLSGGSDIWLTKDPNQTYPTLVLRCTMTGSGGLTYHGHYSQFYDSTDVEIRPVYSNTYTGTTKFDGGNYDLNGGRYTQIWSPNAISLLWTPAISVPGKLIIGGTSDNYAGATADVSVLSNNQIGDAGDVIVHEYSQLDLNKYQDTISDFVCRGNLYTEVVSSTQYGKLTVNGTVTLDSDTSYFGITANAAYSPVAGNNLRFIDNDGVDAVVDQFSNRAQNGNVTLNGTLFKFSYSGGTGNDVRILAQ